MNIFTYNDLVVGFSLVYIFLAKRTVESSIYLSFNLLCRCCITHNTFTITEIDNALLLLDKGTALEFPVNLIFLLDG